MVKNRVVALCYRLVAATIIFAGLVVGSGFSVWPRSMLFYTTQSNMLSLCFLLYLIVRTTIDLFKKGAKGSACYSPRLAMSNLLFISFTFIVFWGLLAPFAQGFRLWSFGNLELHAISPILMTTEYLLFCESGHLRRLDVFFCAIPPLVYVILCTTLGYSGVVFYYSKGIPHYFPYPFMDFRDMGVVAVICVLAISLLYILAACLMVKLDSKRKKPTPITQTTQSATK